MILFLQTILEFMATFSAWIRVPDHQVFWQVAHYCSRADQIQKLQMWTNKITGAKDSEESRVLGLLVGPRIMRMGLALVTNVGLH